MAVVEKAQKTVIEEAEKLVLENRKIKVVPLLRNKAFYKKEHDGNHTFTGCYKIWGLPLSIQSRAYINPFKNNAEQLAFEEILGLEKGALNPNKRESKFWGEFNVRIDKEGLTLDLSIPYDALVYRVLKVNDKFASENDDENVIEYEYKLVDERYEEEITSKNSVKKLKAYEYLFKIQDNKQKMVDTLRLLGVKLTDGVKIDTLKSKIVAIIEQAGSVSDPKLKNIDDFLVVMDDPQASIKLFVFECIDAGEVIIRNGEYRLTENNELIAKSLQSTVDWFNDIKNQEVKLLLEQRLKNK